MKKSVVIGVVVSFIASLLGGAVYFELKMHEQGKEIFQLQETVIAMGAHVIMQDLAIQDLTEKVNKYSGTRTSY